MTRINTAQKTAEEQAKAENEAMDAKIADLFSSSKGKEVLAWHRDKVGFDERVFVRGPDGLMDINAAGVKDGQRAGHMAILEAIKRHHARIEGKTKQTKAKK